HQAQLPGYPRRRGGLDRARGVPRGQIGPARSRVDRHHERRPAVFVYLRLGGRRTVRVGRPRRRCAARDEPPRGPRTHRAGRAPDGRRGGPLVLAGHGIMLAEATEQFRAFVDATGVPVAVTLLGIGALPASHPSNLGMMGMHGEAWVNAAIQEADLLIALGMRFDDRVTGNLKTYAINAKKIHVDIDPAEIGKNVPVDVGIVSNLRDVLEAWQPSLTPLPINTWLDRITSLKGDSAVRDIQNMPDDGHLYAAHVIHDI